MLGMRISVAVSGEEVSPKEQSTSGKRNRKHIGLKASLCVYNVYEHCSRVRSCTRQARQISAIEQADIVKRQCNAAQARDAADYDAIWEDAIACFALPRMDEAIKAYKDGHGGMRGHPIAHVVRARLCKQGYPLPVLVGPDALDKVFCAQTTRIRGPILSLASLLMALLRWSRIFVDENWAKKAVLGFRDKKTKGDLLEPTTDQELLKSSHPVQPGLRFVPFLSNEDTATREQLVHFILGVEPAPEGYEVSQHLLHRPEQPLDLTRYLDPTFVRAWDLNNILLRRLSSVGKNFSLRYDLKLARWYQHKRNNIRLAAAAYSLAKGRFLVPDIAYLVELAIFYTQTASQDTAHELETEMTTSPTTAMSQKDLRAAALLEQGRRQKAELDRMVKASFAHSSSSSTNTTAASSSTSRAGRMHPKDSSAKLLDADIDFARRNLRNTWLNLLFTCTFTREAQSVDGHIWNETSYSLITAYRSYISAAQNSVDPAVQASGRRGKSAQDASRAKAEYRKFLLDEELFWQELVGRLVRLFSLDEARPNLEVLGIDAENDADTSVSSSLPTDSYASRTTRQANEPDETLSQAALLPTKRIHLITLLHRFLIFCGDLARYREMSSHDHNSDGSGSSKKSKSSPKYDFSRASAFYEQARLILPDQGNPSNQLAVVSQYNSDTFASLYHYYRALCVKTPFLKAKINLEKLLAKPTSIYLDEAARSTDDGNSIWDAVKDGQARDPQLVRRLSNNVEDAQQATEAWLKQVVILHGLFYRRGQLSHVMYLSRSVLATFSTLIRARALRADQIVQFLVTALCASWTTRLWRGAPTGSGKESSRPSSAGSEDRHRPVAVRGERSSRKRAASPETARCIEFLVTAHVLGVFNELAAVDTAETRSALESNKELAAAIQQADGQSSPVRNLTGVVRRTLPALRIVSKWIKTHLEYLQRIEKRARDSVQQYGEPDAGVVRSGMEVRPDSERPDPHHAAYTDTLEAMDKCWSQYVDLINSLRYAFPFDSLPNIGKVGTVGARALCLEEDSDMRGFAPTRKATQSTIPGGTTISFGMGEACANIEAVRPSQVHPNEEQLMRIADLMIDAKVIAESDASPIRFDDINNVFVFVRESTTSAVGSGAAAAASAAALSSGRPTVKPVAVGNPEASRNRDGADVDSVSQSLRSVQVGDGGMAADGVRKAGEAPLVPSQVRAKSGMSKDELARQLFAAYPLASESSSGAGSAGSGLAVSSSNDAGLSSAGAARAHHTNFLLSNGAPISSIWAPNASDMAGAALPSHLQYGGSTNLFQQQMQQQQHMSYQPQPQSWPHAAFSQPGAGPYTETYGNTTPDPFNPHGYGASHLYPYQQQQQQHAGFSTSPLNQSQQQQRSTPQSGSTHNGDPAFGVGQNAYYAGPDSSHPPRFA